MNEVDSNIPFTCSLRLGASRELLLRSHFNPTEDTAGWLKVTGLEDGGVLLNIFTEYSPDGDGLRQYEAELHPTPGMRNSAWRLIKRNVLDEFKEERLPERTWTRVDAGWTARIHTRTEDRKLVDLFESAVRPALDDCLAHPGAAGMLERCHYSPNNEYDNQWHCSPPTGRPRQPTSRHG